jgi:hypothetical protein
VSGRLNACASDWRIDADEHDDDHAREGMGRQRASDSTLVSESAVDGDAHTAWLEH